MPEKHQFEFCNSSKGLCDCGLPRTDPIHEQPRAAAQCCLHQSDEHILTAYRRYCTKCSCETSTCLCQTSSGLNESCPMHGGDCFVSSEQPRASEQPCCICTVDPEACSEHRPTQQPAGDAVEPQRTCGSCDKCQVLKAENAALRKQLAVAREGIVSLGMCTGWGCSECLCKNYMPPIPEGYVSLDAVEKAVRIEISSGWGLNAGAVDSVIHHILRRLSPKQPERVTVTQDNHGWHLWRDGVCLNTAPLQEGIAKLAAAGLREELKAGNQ